MIWEEIRSNVPKIATDVPPAKKAFSSNVFGKACGW
jgi:hypothetical protein